MTAGPATATFRPRGARRRIQQLYSNHRYHEQSDVDGTGPTHVLEPIRCVAGEVVHAVEFFVAGWDDLISVAWLVRLSSIVEDGQVLEESVRGEDLARSDHWSPATVELWKPIRHTLACRQATIVIPGGVRVGWEPHGRNVTLAAKLIGTSFLHGIGIWSS